MIFGRPSIPKDLLGRKFGENHFYPHWGAPFWENFSKVEKIAILTLLKNVVPSPIERWSVTKWNQVMSWNYQIIRSSEVIGLLRIKNDPIYWMSECIPTITFFIHTLLLSHKPVKVYRNDMDHLVWCIFCATFL